MAPPKFKDLLKAPSDLLSDDFTSKKSIKFKLPTGGITFNAENEFKLSKSGGVESIPGKITCKYAHKPSKVSVDKLEFKGDTAKLELSYPFAGGKVKGKGDMQPGKDLGGSVEFDTCVGGASVLAALNLNKFKLDLSAVTGMKGLNVGAKVQADKSGIKGYDAGANYSVGSLMLGVTSADKFAAATCGLMYKVTPLLTLALTGTVPKNDFVLGGSFKASDTLSVKAKVGMDNVLEAVANTKIADALKVDIGATVPLTKPEDFKLGFLVNLG